MYALRDENGKINGYTRWPNEQTSEEIDEESQEWLDYLNPPSTDQELKMIGVEFEGVMCSATAEDMWGLSSVKGWLEAGAETNFKFQNGNTLKLTALNIGALEAVWIPFRAAFFE